MFDSPATSGSMQLLAGLCSPRYHCDHADGTHSVSMIGATEMHNVYLNGTLDELAAFVLQLASVVRELNDQELARLDRDDAENVTHPALRTRGSFIVPRFDGTRAPVQAVVDELQARR